MLKSDVMKGVSGKLVFLLLLSSLLLLLNPYTASAGTETITYEYYNSREIRQVTYGSGSRIVYAYDGSGNMLSKTVDIPPDTVITETPASLSNSTTAQFSFMSTQPNSTFECSLDSGSYAACASPKQYTGLPNGLHTFRVRALNASGNPDLSPASFEWIIDATPPLSAITHPSGSFVIADTYTIRGTASDIGSSVSRVEVSINNGAWMQASGTASWSYQWTIPSDGPYTIRTRATDAAGNVETPAAGITVSSYKRSPSSVTINNKQLRMNGSPFMVKGVVYSPVPIGHDPETTPPHGDYFTTAHSSIYNRDLPLLRSMGANTVRLWTWDSTADHAGFLDAAYNGGVTPIYVIPGFWINPGLDIDPASQNNVRGQLIQDFREMVSLYKNHPAVLMWTIGNELNADSIYGGNKASLFSLINEMAGAAHQEEGTSYHPVTTPLADENLINTISTYESSVPNLDIWGANLYRGNTFGTLFSSYRAASSKPLIMLEYGIDAYDNTSSTEHEFLGNTYQADYAEALWNEMLANADVCTGGTIKEYSDQWWKGSQSSDPACIEDDPLTHGRCGYATAFSPDGYSNEEWYGIMRPVYNVTGPDTMQKRVLYYALQSLWPQTAQNAIFVTSPNGGETWVAGTTKTIKWRYSGNPGANVKIETLRSGGSATTIIASTPIGSNGVGSYNWTIPAKQTASTAYQIRIASTTNTNIKDLSDNYFTITPPTITVISPNGGETWQAGTSRTITWTYTGNPGAFVKIETERSGSRRGTVVSSTPIGTNGFGSYTWTIPTGQTLSTSYKIRIQSTSDSKIFDFSDSFFSIQR